MTLEQLRIFVAVAELEHVTRAARRLNLTQSAVSQAISTLEERHGVALFHRVGRSIALSETGRDFLSEARAVLASADHAATMLAETGSLLRGTLRVAASQTIAAYWLPPCLAEYRRRHPGIEIDLSIANTREAARRVVGGEAEFAMVEGAIDEPSLASWQIASDELLLVAPSGAVVADDDDWLRSASWVLREPGSGTRAALADMLASREIAIAELGSPLVMPSNEAVRTAVENGAGIALLSRLVVAGGIAAGTMEPLPVAPIKRAFYGLRHKERYWSKAAEALLPLIADGDAKP